MQKTTDPAFFWIGLSSISGIGRATFRKLIRHFGSPEQVLAAGRDELSTVERLTDKAIEEINGHSWQQYAEQELARARDSGARIIIADSPDYPPSLRNTPDPPLFLYVRGRLGLREGIAIVGTRKPTHYGLTVTHRMAYELAAAGLTVVSGMARGIDTQAHRGALAAKGSTIAVLACGLDVVYPPENKSLMQEISRSGAIISENPFGTKPEAGYFPARNRIISGLSAGTVIVEAAEDSGSLITADYAREQGRQLFAVPGNIGSISSRGANTLIKQGAMLVDGAGDILRAFGMSRSGKKAEPAHPAPPLSPEEESAFRCVTNVPKHIDMIMNEARTTPGRLCGIMTCLELKGLVRQLAGKYYVREG